MFEKITYEWGIDYEDITDMDDLFNKALEHLGRTNSAFDIEIVDKAEENSYTTHDNYAPRGKDTLITCTWYRHLWGAYHVADWNTGEDYCLCQTEEDALAWMRSNCTNEDGNPWTDNEEAYYNGCRVELH